MTADKSLKVGAPCSTSRSTPLDLRDDLMHGSIFSFERIFLILVHLSDQSRSGSKVLMRASNVIFTDVILDCCTFEEILDLPALLDATLYSSEHIFWNTKFSFLYHEACGHCDSTTDHDMK